MIISNKGSLEKNMKPPVKALLIYRKLKKAIVDGIYPPGSFLPNETALAVNFGVSRNTLRSALTRLAEEKFIDRICSKGTIVCPRGNSTLQIPLTFLLQCPDYISNTMKHPENLFMCRMLSGYSQVAYNNGYRVEIVPILPNYDEHDIAWEKVNHLNSDSMVIVCGHLFEKLFPLLLERKCKVAFVNHQINRKLEKSNAEKWFMIELKRAEAVCAIIRHMRSIGQNRIALLHGDITEKNHPILRGYLAGLKKYALDYSAWQEFPQGDLTPPKIIKIVADFYEQARFDTLIINAYLLLPLCREPYLNRALGLPDSVKIVMLNNLEHLFNTFPSPWWTDFHWTEIGICGAEALINEEAPSFDKKDFYSILIKDHNIVNELHEDISDFKITENLSSNCRYQISNTFLQEIQLSK